LAGMVGTAEAGLCDGGNSIRTRSAGCHIAMAAWNAVLPGS